MARKTFKITPIIILASVLAGSAWAEDALAPPAGIRERFSAHAKGVQIYLCQEKAGEPGETRFTWAFVAPEAELSDDQGHSLGRHAKGPSWTLNDGASVTAELVAKQPAPEPGAIPWLLLKVTTHQGAGQLEGVAFIRRVETNGGVQPEAGCDASHIGNVARVPYTAIYQFFGP